MKEYKASWESPSNIALVKYWGKKPDGVQLPSNASISFTLSKCVSKTSLTFREGKDFGIEILLDGNPALEFIPKVESFLKRISAVFPFVLDGSYSIETSNSFPHSSGIASSASGMSALALCICSIAVEKGQLKEADFMRTASRLARLGSGSASRSVFGPLAIWGEHSEIAESNDEFAIPYADIHPKFEDFCDTILLVHRGQKEVSSSMGHDLIKAHPFAKARFKSAEENMIKILHALKAGEMSSFIQLVESEALMLHALMMSSNPYFILMKPNTLAIIEAIWAKRKSENLDWMFTLDAGANVHFLYPKRDEQKAISFVDNELSQYCQDGAYICDQIGFGPREIN